MATAPTSITALDSTTQFGNISSTGALPLNPCLVQDRKWPVFVASTLITFFGGLVLILGYRVVAHVVATYRRSGDGNRRSLTATTIITDDDDADGRRNQPKMKVTCLTRTKWKVEAYISGQTIVGRIMVSLSCILSIGSLTIYLMDASNATTNEENGCAWGESSKQKVDLAFNMFFLLYFVMRFIAATDKLTFWLEIHSFVDFFTVPPIFVSIVLNRQWLGLRFLRALRLISFPDVLQYLNILRTSNTIRLTQLVCIFLSVWLSASGFIHLLEITGDPFNDYQNAQELTYWECVYFVIVTMSTVGYGDIHCQTILGRWFMIIFILGALAMFASFIPEIMDIVGKRNRYRGNYDKPAGVRHIVICGHISYESVHNFLRDFLHEDRVNQNIKCIFLDSKNPDLELEALFKRHFTQVMFFKGTAMNTRDLDRVKLRESDACLVMANPRCSNPDAEDAANIMRVISIKNFNQDIRVIVQLMRYHNKAFCVNLPSWTLHDQVICLAEMKLGFMAQGCLAPGISTLLANLFVMRSYKKSSKYLQWQDNYLRGAGMEVYTSHFSKAFYGVTFSVAAEICYKQLKLLLVAITVKKDDRNEVLLNPGDKILVDDQTSGFFICQSEDEVRRLLNYCHRCHSCLKHVEQIRPCHCIHKDTIVTSLESVNGSASLVGMTKTTMDTSSIQLVSYQPKRSFENLQLRLRQSNNNDANGSPSSLHPDLSAVFHDSPDEIASHTNGRLISEKLPKISTPVTESFDSTGLYHWCPSRKFEDAALSYKKNAEVLKRLTGHVVVCIFSEAFSPLIGLCNFVMPLRASNIHRKELRKVVIIGNREFLKREWELLKNFPDIYIKMGSPLNRSDLRYVKINKCYMTVIFAAHDSSITDDATLIDKEAILCSLNIKTMTFQLVADLWKGSSPKKTLRMLALLRGGTDDSRLSQRKTAGTWLPMLTELANDYNAQFLDQDDEDDPDTPLYMTQPFACGRAFAASVLDTLMSTTFFNPDAISLVRSLISGGGTPDILEESLAEGHTILPWQHSTEEVRTLRDRCRLTLIPLEDSVLSDFSNEDYGTLVISALRNLGIICLGLYRQMSLRPSMTSYHRIVITNPPSDFSLYPSDKVYCLEPFNRTRTTSQQTINSNGL